LRKTKDGKHAQTSRQEYREQIRTERNVIVGAGDECDSTIETTLGLMKFYSLSDIGTQNFSTANTTARRSI
jgi:hypothetical protein